VIFDLDGTLVDSGLDFDSMRSEMGLAAGHPILEALALLGGETAARGWAILARHERAGVERAELMPGVREFLQALDARGLRRAVVTRNSRELARATLDRFALDFEVVHGREDGPVKPDPAAIRSIAASWQLSPAQVAMVGDYRFDLESGRAAGARTVLYTAGRPAAEFDYLHLADRLLTSFEQPGEILAWLAEPV
jgi:HAD superfamily hydrolase (TIGR01509 family)